MNGSHEDRFVDELLDASLRKYRSEEPRAGLEARILVGARTAERAAQRRGAWVWVLGAAAAGLAVVAVVVSWPRQARLPVAAPTLSSAPLAATKLVAPPASLVGERSALPRAGGARPYRAPRAGRVARRPEQFPTPMPLSEQERLLLLYVKTADQSGLAAQAIQSSGDQDLEIPKVSIAALDIKLLPGSMNDQER